MATFGKPIVVLSRKLKAKREFRVFRFGDNPTTKGTFKLTQESAAKLMDTYRSRGLWVTFDYDHHSLINRSPGDGKSAGKCKLEQRADGIWACAIEWTPTAQKEIEDGEWVYFSPAFDDVNKEIIELVNIALTNIPAMDRLDVLAANRAGELVQCVIKHEDGKWKLYDSSGKKLLGTYDTEQQAKAQESAVNISKAREAGHHVPPPKEATAMKHPISEHLQNYAKGGGALADVAKGTGIHADRIKALHDGDGDGPSGEELRALAKHFKFGPDQMKAMSVPEGAPVKASAIDGQDVDRVGGDDDDDVEHEDLEGAKPTLARRDDATVKLLTMLTGTADPKKQAARLKVMQEKSLQWEDDHKTITALRAEREAEKRNLLIEKGKADGKLTPALVRWAMSQDVEALEEFLKHAPVALNVRSSVEVPSADGKETTTLSREEADVARLCGIEPEEMVAAKKMLEATPEAELKKQRSAMSKMFRDMDKEPARGFIAMRKATGVRA